MSPQGHILSHLNRTYEVRKAAFLVENWSKFPKDNFRKSQFSDIIFVPCSPCFYFAKILQNITQMFSQFRRILKSGKSALNVVPVQPPSLFSISNSNPLLELGLEVGIVVRGGVAKRGGGGWQKRGICFVFVFYLKYIEFKKTKQTKTPVLFNSAL